MKFICMLEIVSLILETHRGSNGRELGRNDTVNHDGASQGVRHIHADLDPLLDTRHPGKSHLGGACVCDGQEVADRHLQTTKAELGVGDAITSDSIKLSGAWVLNCRRTLAGRT